MAKRKVTRHLSEDEVQRLYVEWREREEELFRARQWLTRYTRLNISPPWLAPLGTLHSVVSIDKLADMLKSGREDDAAKYVRGVMIALEGEEDGWSPV